MKKSIFLMMLIFSFLSYIPQGQSQTTRVIEVNDDDGSLYIKYEENELVKLKIDGKTIAPKDYRNYEDLIKQHSKSSPSTPSTPSPPSTSAHDDEGEQLNAEILKILEDNDLISNSRKYKFNFTPNKLRVNGKKMSKEMLNLCLAAFENVYGYELPYGGDFSIKISPSSRSISFSVEN